MPIGVGIPSRSTRHHGSATVAGCVVNVAVIARHNRTSTRCGVQKLPASTLEAERGDTRGRDGVVAAVDDGGAGVGLRLRGRPLRPVSNLMVESGAQVGASRSGPTRVVGAQPLADFANGGKRGGILVAALAEDPLGRKPIREAQPACPSAAAGSGAPAFAPAVPA